MVALVGETGREVYQARLDYDLRRAIVARNGRAAYDLLQKGADSNAQFADSEKPFQWQYRSWPFLRQGSRQPPLRVYPRSQLFMAVFNGDTDMARLLLHAGADPNRVERSAGESAFLVAVNSQNMAIVRVFLQNGADVNSRGREGWTPLIVAAALGNADLVRLLLAAGADPRARDNKDRTAFYYAAKYNKTKVKSLLLHASGSQP